VISLSLAFMMEKGVLFLQGKAKETSGLINPENNPIGGKKLSTAHAS
jgi:hypothetical protein